MDERARTDEASVWISETSSAVALPSGWTVVEDARVPMVRGPEGDVDLGFVTVPADPSDADTAVAAWCRLESPLELEVQGDQEVPASGGWERARQIVYRVRGRDELIVVALLRMFRGNACVSLIVATRAGLDRRSAQLMQLMQGWQPEGLLAEDLSSRKARAWGQREREAMGDFMRHSMEALGIPGVSMAIVQNGRIVECSGFGQCGVDAPEPVTGDTRFMIGSVTKPLTTLMMARLVDEGRFAWSTPVMKLLPDFAFADAMMTERLQMRHTVSASTGMPRCDIELAFGVDGGNPERCLARLKQQQPTTGFGETFQYSNQLVALGGFAAAAASSPESGLATAYRKAMREEVFAPLRMRRTLLQCPRRDRALAHAPDLAGVARPIDMRMETFVDTVAPAGAVWSTARDMARYLQMELAGGLDAQGGIFLARGGLEARHEAQIRIGGQSSYGLGLILANEHGLNVLGHGGATLGFSADMWFVPAQDFGVIVLANLAGVHDVLAGVRQKILELLLGAEEKSEEMISLAVRARVAVAAARSKRIRTDAETLAWIDDLVGTYVSADLGQACIEPCPEGYRMQLDAWSSALAVAMNDDGSRQLALVSPPWSAGLCLRIEDGGETLVCDAGQQRYTFCRQRGSKA